MKIVFFGNATEKIAAIRYRVIWFADRLRAEGHACVVCLPSSVAAREQGYEGRSRWAKLLYLGRVWLTRWAQLRHVIGADVVFFRGSVFDYGPTFFERVIHLFCKHLVFDIDDAVWEAPAHVDSPFVRWMDFDWTWKLCRISSHAVVGNRVLKDRVAPLMGTDAVSIVPTVALALVRQTRLNQPETPKFITEWLSWGAGPRAVQVLLLGSKARALLQGRTHVTTDDVAALAAPVLRHRIVVNFAAESDGMTTDKVVERMIQETPNKESDLSRDPRFKGMFAA